MIGQELMVKVRRNRYSFLPQSYTISLGMLVAAPLAFIAAHCAANCVRSTASSADSCGFVVEPLMAISNRMQVARSGFIVYSIP
jgi:hypothetical protein